MGWIKKKTKRKNIEELNTGKTINKYKAKKTKIIFRKSVIRILNSRFFKIFFIIFILTIIGIGIRYFILSERFEIKNIEVKGNSHLKESFFKEKLEDSMGKNIFLTRSSGLQKQLATSSPYIKELRVEKKLPRTITINLQERSPTFAWMNFSGFYLVDSEGVVLEVIKDFDNLQISQEDIDLLKGYANLEVVEDPNIEKKDENEEENSHQSEQKEEKKLNYQEKINIIDQNKLEVASRVDLFWVQRLEEIDKYYMKYKIIYSYNQNDFKELDKLNNDLISATEKILQIKFDQDIKRYLWESDYRFVIYFYDREIVFSIRRDIDRQIEDLSLLLSEIKLKDERFRYIDLSSEVIVYEVE